MIGILLFVKIVQQRRRPGVYIIPPDSSHDTPSCVRYGVGVQWPKRRQVQDNDCFGLLGERTADASVYKESSVDGEHGNIRSMIRSWHAKQGPRGEASA